MEQQNQIMEVDYLSDEEIFKIVASPAKIPVATQNEANSKLHKVAAEKRGYNSPILGSADLEVKNTPNSKFSIHSLVNNEKEVPRTTKDQPDKSVPKKLPAINYERIKQNIEKTEAKIRALVTRVSPESNGKSEGISNNSENGNSIKAKDKNRHRLSFKESSSSISEISIETSEILSSQKAGSEELPKKKTKLQTRMEPNYQKIPWRIESKLENVYF